MRVYSNYQALHNMVKTMQHKSRRRSHITTNQLARVIYAVIMSSHREFVDDNVRKQLIADILRLAQQQTPKSKRYRKPLLAGNYHFEHLIGDNDRQQLQRDLMYYVRTITKDPRYRWWWHIEHYKAINHLQRHNDQAALKMLGYSYLVESTHKDYVRQLLMAYAKEAAIDVNALTNMVCLLLAKTPDTVAEFKVSLADIVALSQHLPANYAIANNVELEAAHYLSHSKQLTRWCQNHTNDELNRMLLGAGTLIITSPMYADWQTTERVWRSSIAIDLETAAK